MDRLLHKRHTNVMHPRSLKTMPVVRQGAYVDPRTGSLVYISIRRDQELKLTATTKEHINVESRSTEPRNKPR